MKVPVDEELLEEEVTVVPPVVDGVTVVPVVGGVLGAEGVVTVLEMVIVTGFEVRVLFAASLAMAVRV